MIFAPHILQKKVIIEGTLINGNPVPGIEEWVEIGECRCDDNEARTQISVNGVLHDYSYHVVYEGEKLPIGTEIQCLDKADGSLRGEGKVIKPKKCNYFPHAEIWVE